MYYLFNRNIRSDQYNFIKSQAYILANGHATANDRGVIQALKCIIFSIASDFNAWITPLSFAVACPFAKI
jgi:hypothetical protein